MRSRGLLQVVRRVRAAHERGMVAVEAVAALCLLVIPAALLVATLPQWHARAHAGTVIASEVARIAEQSWPNIDRSAIDVAIVDLGNNLGVDPSSIRWSIDDDNQRGGSITANVTVRMPTLLIPAIGRVGAWTYSTSQSIAIDSYRSR